MDEVGGHEEGLVVGVEVDFVQDEQRDVEVVLAHQVAVELQDQPVRLGVLEHRFAEDFHQGFNVFAGEGFCEPMVGVADQFVDPVFELPEVVGVLGFEPGHVLDQCVREFKLELELFVGLVLLVGFLGDVDEADDVGEGSAEGDVYPEHLQSFDDDGVLAY